MPPWDWPSPTILCSKMQQYTRVQGLWLIRASETANCAGSGETPGRQRVDAGAVMALESKATLWLFILYKAHQRQTRQNIQGKGSCLVWDPGTWYFVGGEWLLAKCSVTLMPYLRQLLYWIFCFKEIGTNGSKHNNGHRVMRPSGDQWSGNKFDTFILYSILTFNSLFMSTLFHFWLDTSMTFKARLKIKQSV